MVLLLLGMIFAAPAGAQEPTGTIIVDMVTDPSGDPQSFDFTLTDIGGFESGDLAGWTAGGTEAVEALQASNLSPSMRNSSSQNRALSRRNCRTSGRP